MLLPHSKKDLGLRPGWCRAILCLFFLASVRSSLPRSKGMEVKFISLTKFAHRCECGRELLSVPICQWCWLVKGVPCFGSLIIRHPHLDEQASWTIPLDWCFFTCIDAAVGSKLAFYLFLLHFSVITRYKAFLRSWASFIESSWGTVSSIIATCLDESGVKTKSGLSDILAMHCGNFSCFPRSTFSCQLVAVFLSPWPFHFEVLQHFSS